MTLTKEELKNRVLEYDWEPWIFREYDAFVLSLFIGGNSRESMLRLGFDIEHSATLSENNEWFQSKKVYEEALADIQREVKNGLSIKVISESCEVLRAESKDRIAELINNSTKSNLEKFKEVVELIKPFTSYIWLSHDFEYYYTPIMRTEVAKYFNGDIDKVVGDLSFPVKKNSHNLLEDGLIAEDDVQALLKEFGWMYSRDGFVDGFTENDLLELKKKLSAEPKPKTPQIEIPEPLQKYVDELRELVYFRTFRTDAMFELLYLARPITEAIGQDYGIEFQALRNYSVDDLIAGKPVEYPQGITCATFKNQGFFYSEPILKQKEREVSEIKGMVAYPGKVRGKVKVINKFDEIGKVEEGDILVTHMTVPSFILAMKKAAGFVTNEGGMTCHAAIIAREMKKPCITGTKIATKILKDGDFVEVDADKGTVKKIN